MKGRGDLPVGGVQRGAAPAAAVQHCDTQEAHLGCTQAWCSVVRLVVLLLLLELGTHLVVLGTHLLIPSSLRPCAPFFLQVDEGLKSLESCMA